MFRNKKDCGKHKQKIRKRMEWNGHMPPQQLHALQYTSHYSEMQFSLWEKKKIKKKNGGQTCSSCNLEGELSTICNDQEEIRASSSPGWTPWLSASPRRRGAAAPSASMWSFGGISTLCPGLSCTAGPELTPGHQLWPLPCRAEGQDCSLGLLWPLPGQPRMLVAFLVPRERCWLVFNSVSSRT